MQFFLKAKAWQIFLLSFGIPCGLAVLAGILTRSSEDPGTFFLLMTPVMALFVGVSLAWYWSLGSFLNQRIREEIRPRDTWFRRGLIYVSVYMPIFLGGWAACAVALRLGFLPATTTRFHLVVTGAIIMVLCHLLAMVAMIYALYFVSKNLAIVAKEADAANGQSVLGNFLLFCFFPISVWFVQPVVNRMWMEQETA